MGAPQLGVVALVSDDSSIGPAGIHLRWLYPPALGYPDKGFKVFRLETQDLKWVCRSPAGKAAIGPVPNGYDAGWFRLHYSDHVAVLTSFGPNAARGLSIPFALSGHELVLAFEEPIVRCRVTFHVPRSQLRLRAFSGDREVARTTVELSGGSNTPALTVVGSNITAVGVSLGAREISEVCFTPANSINWGEPLIHLDLPDDHFEATQRFEDGMHNRYAPVGSDATLKYDAPANDLVDTCKALLAPDLRFVDPTLPMSELILQPPEGTPLGGYRPHQFLLLAATDPNVARMLGLYWVDRADLPDGPQLGNSYAYMVCGLWSDVSGHAIEAFGYAMDVGVEIGLLPDFGPGALAEGDVVPGRRWRGRAPLSRIALRWARADTSVTGMAVTPVAYDVTRHGVGGDELLTGKSVVIVPHSTFEKKTACMVDDAVPIGVYRYGVQPIDIFGQVGDAAITREIEVDDLEAPPPPVRVTTQLSQAGFPWRTAENRALAEDRAQVRVAFEYGAAQWRQAPDAQNARLYWRADSPFDEIEGTFTAASSSPEPDGGRRHWALSVSSTSSFEPEQFTGGVARLGVSGAIADRRAFAILDALPPDQIVISGAVDFPLEQGDCILRSDSHRRDLWQRIGPDLVLDNGRALQLTTSLHETTALVIAGRVLATPVVPDQHVLQLDFGLFESGVLDGSTITAGTVTRTITASRSGASTQLLLDGDLVADVGTTVSVTLPADSSLRVAHVSGATSDELGFFSAEPGGELAFEVAGDFVAARVLGATEAISGDLQLLVRLPGDTRPAAGVPTRYRGRHFANFTAALAAAGPGDVLLPIKDGVRTGHVALTCVDLRGNEGPLSAAVPFTAVRPPPTSVPAPPYPCGNATALDGYATPPDANGFATLCLAWETNSNLRYEVGRALDRTVLSIDRQRWLTADREPGLGSWPVEITHVAITPEGAYIHITTPAGLDPTDLLRPAVQQGDHIWHVNRITGEDYLLTGSAQPATGAAILLAAPIRLGRTLSARLSIVDNQVVAHVAAEDASRLAGGRLDADAHRYRITSVRPHKGGGVALILRPITQDAPAPPIGAVLLNEPPDHSLIATNTAVLHALAGKAGNEDAFALVSGVPIDGNTFRDELPGRGSNVFFYRIRGVDPAGNTTAWSPVSVPIRLVDTTPPALPTNLLATAGERMVDLNWRHNRAGWSMTYHVLRSGGPDPDAPEIEVGVVDASESHSDQHTYLDRSVAGLLPGEAYVYRIRVVKHVPRADAPPIDVEAVSQPVRARAFDTTPPSPPADFTLARTGETSVRVTWSTPEPMTWLLKRQPPDGDIPTIVVHAGPATSATFEGGRWWYTYDDTKVSITPGWFYTLILTNRLGRQSAPAHVQET